MRGLKISAFLFSILTSLIAQAQQGVQTQHNDLGRTGWNNKEVILNTRNVLPGKFGKLFTRPVDDQIYAQPLVMLNVAMPGIGSKNVVFVATVNNSVYAFDADSANVTSPYWQVNLSPSGTRAVVNTDMTGACGGGYRDFSGKMGIVGTPVIDSTTNTLYVVARSVTTAAPLVFKQYLHALDLTTGVERPFSPQLITAQVSGTGDGSVGGKVNFDPQKNNQRPGLLLLNGVVYITWSSHCDWGPYHGWMIGYDKATLAQVSVYNTTPDGYNGGMWMSGAGPSADESGNIYTAVGNGSVGVGSDKSNLRNRSESALKLVPGAGTLTVASFFTPMNQQDLENADLDFGVTEMLLIPGTNRVMTGCKDGNLYLMNRDTMGGFNATSNNVLQTISLGPSAHLRSSLAYFKGQTKEFVYSWSENAALRAFPYNRTTRKFDLGNTVLSGVQGPAGNNGAFLSVSSNHAVDSTAILWAAFAANGDANQSVRPGILRAFDANDITKEIWNSAQYPLDNPGNYAKFNCPTVSNGKVYLATFSNQLVVFGLLKNPRIDTCNSTNIGLHKTSEASSVESGGTIASLAFDGDPNTRWSSAYTDPQYILVDLGKRYDLCKVVLKWETALGLNFSIESSDDKVSWTTLVSITGNTSSENYLPVSGTGRYVRMYGTARGTVYGYSLWEFEVYGNPSASQCPQPTATLVTDIYETSSVLHWNANGASQFVVQYKAASASGWQQSVVNTNQFPLTGLGCSTDYLYRIRAVCNATDSSYYSATAAFSTLTCNSNCPPLPTRWTTLDIGDVDAAGSACYVDGAFELRGSGADIWDVADGFRFAYKTFVGDGEIVARVVSMDNSDPWNKCGIMIRESLDEGSRHAFIALTSGNGVAFQNRIVTDGISYNASTPDISAPHWIRLVKSGTQYTGYFSSNGIDWQQVGLPVNAMFGSNTPVYAGLALTSHYNGILSAATVDNFRIALDKPTLDLRADATLSKSIQLQWSSVLGSGMDSFVIERGIDFVNYTDVAMVPAATTGAFTHLYQYEDTQPQEGINYYRLRISYQDGTSGYSTTVYARVSNGSAPLLFPNPSTKGWINVQQGEEVIQSVTLYTTGGQQVGRIYNSLGYLTVEIPVALYSNGMYILEIRTSGNSYRKKVVIQN